MIRVPLDFVKHISNEFGYCYYVFERDCVDPEYPIEIAFVFNLYIEPRHRRQGKARALLNEVIESIRYFGHNGEIRIEAQPRENSIDHESLTSFYESLGLKVVQL